MTTLFGFATGLVADVLYGSTKELLRVGLAACVTLLVQQLLSERGACDRLCVCACARLESGRSAPVTCVSAPARPIPTTPLLRRAGAHGRLQPRMVQRLKTLCAICFLGFTATLAVARFVERCGEEQLRPGSEGIGMQASGPFVDLCSLVPQPPPPPPPSPSERAVRSVGRAVAWCRQHPAQLAISVGALVLADLLNVAIAVDSADPLVRLVQALSRPFHWVGRALWRRALRWREATLLRLAARTAS